MKELLLEEFPDYMNTFEDKRYGGVRVNTLKITPEEFEKISPFEIRKIPWISNGYYFNLNDQPAKHPYYYAGLYYIQEPSAMTPANILQIDRDDIVLDLCAAPGGKSTELASKLGGTGVLVTNDISHSRAKALLKNVELFGITNAIITNEDSVKLRKFFPEFFDKILVDAPCSGEGMFRKDPAIIKNWENQGVEYYSDIQKEIILDAADMLKPGGLLLYSTCTFSPEENEATIEYLLNNRDDFSVEVIPMKEGFEKGRPEWVGGREELNRCVRLWPHKIEGEGHFLALLRKKERLDTINKKKNRVNKGANLPQEFKDFLKDFDIVFKEERFELRDEKLYYMPDVELPQKGLRILRSGFYFGDVKKNRFEPSQSLAMGIKMSEYNKIINLNCKDDNVIKYLKCETIELEKEYKNVWYLICVDGYPLGWGKVNGQTVKNKYQAGWRWL
jgi:NOL1/NOP2/sun family putative RNA methylase